MKYTLLINGISKSDVEFYCQIPCNLSQEPCVSHDVHQVDNEISHIKECASSMNCELW